MTLTALRRPRTVARSTASHPPNGAPAPRNVFATALGIAVVVFGMLLAAVVQSGGDWYDARMGALITFNLLHAIAGTLYYLVWRLNLSATAGWLAVGFLGVPLSELPFLMMGSVASPAAVLPGGEFQELLAVALMAWFLARGARGRGFESVSPFLWALGTAIILGLMRALGLRLDEGTLEASSPLGIVQRLALIALLATAAVQVRRLDLPVRGRWTLGVALCTTGTFAVLDDGSEEPIAAAVVAVSLVVLLLVGAGLVDGALHLTMTALLQRQDELTRLAVRVAAAEEAAAREGAVLDAVRSTVVPLSRASGALQTDTSLPPREREVVAEAMRREIDRIHRTLGGTTSEPQAFAVDDLIGPLAEFQRAQGVTVLWVPTGLTAVHDPDTVARALGVCLDVMVGEQSATVLVRSEPPEGPNGPMRVRVYPQSLSEEPLTSVFLKDGLARLPRVSAPENVSLTSVERLLQAHAGGLGLLLPPDRADQFGLELTLPFRPMSRNRPLPH